MSTLSPSRPSRRTARRRAVIESSDEEDNQMDVDNDTEEEFTPAPRRTTRTTRQSTSEVKPTPKRTTRSRQSHAVEGDGESTIHVPDGIESAKQQSPSKKASPRKRPAGRPSVRLNRKQRISAQIADINEESAALPTPEPSASPDGDATTGAPKPASPRTPISPTRRDSTPLVDITEQAINEQPLKDRGPEISHVDPRVTKLENPMDIVIRTRQAALPKIEEQAKPTARLVITYLILTNFKSYAGRQEVGPFHASFSSVVGPNGSGKSNVIDSLLFVFGFRASKMRQGKLSALIHNSAAHPDVDFCEVEVHFEEVKDLPDGGHQVIPDSKLVVSRRAFKNNSSTYHINGRSSNFTTVTTLLKERGIDLDHKRFLILQGEVESIAQMKPKAANEHDDGLLEYLEDIIGTSKYKTPIEEAALETEQLNEVCAEKNNRVQHVERERNSLEDKKNRALEYIADENDLAFKKSALYQVHVQECSDKIEVANDAALKVQSQLDEELRKHHGGEEEIKRLEKKYKSASKEFGALEKRTQLLGGEMSKLDKESVKLEEKKKFLSNKEKKLEKSLQSSQFAAKDAGLTINQCSDDIERITAQISELESQMKVEEEELAAIRQSLKGKTEGLSKEIAAKQKSLEPWNEKISSKKSSMAVAQSELDILQGKANAGALAIAEVEAKLVSLKESKTKKEEELSESRQRITDIKEEVEAVKKQLGALAKDEPKLRSALSDACQKADEARASLSSSQTQGNVLAGLMHLKESGRISGFHGRLGNLGTIDSKYDIAISTACPSLDNLVVDSVEIGQQCIEYLRKSNLGRAHFILLDRLPQRDLSPIPTPENVPRLFDLVKSRDDKFRPAFYSVLQNTLVADTLEQANRIAYGQKRWRVVTLGGQLIDKSGTMSGGGTRVVKGGMSSKLAASVSKDQVSKMEVDRDALERQLQAHLKQQRELNDTFRDLNEQLPQLETMTQKCSMEISSIERNIADAMKRIKEIGAEKNTTQSDKSRMASLEKMISGAEKDIAKLHSEMASVEEEIKALQDKIMEIGGVRLRGQKAKVDGLKEQIDTMTGEMSASDVSRAKAEKNKQKHEKALAEANTERERLALDFQKVDEDAKRQRDLVSGSNEALSAAQDELDTKKEELQSLKSELDSKTAELNECRGVEIEMRNKLEQIEKTCQESRKRLKHWEEELGKLELKNTNDSDEEQEGAGLPTHSRDELLGMDRDSLKDEISQLEARLQKVTDVDLGVLREYRRRVEEHATRSADLAEALTKRDAAKKRCDELRKLRLEGFMEGFSIISMRLKEMYQMITMGGNAELELVDSLDPFSEGILFSVMPPKKSWKNISNLSGGEKTLSSLALVFALHHYKPTPLYVMDEIDAALDFRNVSIVASYIKERTKNGQFIVISLRNNMFELASRLVGVYKVNHMTKSVTIENKDYLIPA